MASIFTRDFGRRQGRIAPVGTVARDGTYVFCLGFDSAGHFEEVEEGDFVEVAQTATLIAGTKLLRVFADVRAPADVPVGFQWELALLVDDEVRVKHVFAPGARLRRRQLSVNVSKLTGSHKLALRLQLVSTSGTQYLFPAGVASAEDVPEPEVTT